MNLQQSIRFLTQATYGPTTAEANALVGADSLKEAWIDAQLALPASLHRPSVEALGPEPRDRQAVWWRLSLTAPDQLRQRVAFALSEILVISDVPDNMGSDPAGCAEYYDILLRGAFGPYTTVLKNISLSPLMGRYLSHLRNAKANVILGTTPDENFAREIMQLFSIGLWQLNADGTRVSPETPTYGQSDITNMARVWTGWNYANAIGWFDYSANYLQMQPNEAYHDTDAKTVLGQSFTAGNTAMQDCDRAIEILTANSSCAPFICRQLIQRLTVSQPTPGYVSRMVTVWNSTSGNLGVVVKAILLDVEASFTGTKMREPLLMQTALWRALGVSSPSGQYRFDNPQNNLGQASLRSPSVFNFFRPDTEPAPEIELLSHVGVIELANNWYRNFYEAADIVADVALLTSLAASPATLVDYLSLALRQGQMNAGERAAIIGHLNQVPSLDTRARDAAYLTMSSPFALVIPALSLGTGVTAIGSGSISFTSTGVAVLGVRATGGGTFSPGTVSATARVLVRGVGSGFLTFTGSSTAILGIPGGIVGQGQGSLSFSLIATARAEDLGEKPQLLERADPVRAANTSRVLRAPGTIVINPTEALTGTYPFGGTEVGKANLCALQPMEEQLRLVWEGTGETGEILEGPNRWIFACFLRGWDDEAIRLLMPDGWSIGDRSQHSVFSAPGLNLAGLSALSRAVKLLYVPEDPVHVPAILIYSAVPDWQNGAELAFRRSDELGLPMSFECVRDVESRILKVGRLVDLEL